MASHLIPFTSVADLLEGTGVAAAYLDGTGAPVSSNARYRLLTEGPAGADARELTRQAFNLASPNRPAQGVRSLGSLGLHRMIAMKAPDGRTLVVFSPDADRTQKKTLGVLGTLFDAIGGRSPVGLTAMMKTLAEAQALSLAAYFVFERGSRTWVCRGSFNEDPGLSRLLISKPDDPLLSCVAAAHLRRAPTLISSLEASAFPVERIPDSNRLRSALAVPLGEDGILLTVMDGRAPSDADLREFEVVCAALPAIFERLRESETGQASREALQHLLAQMPDAILEQGADGRVLRAYGNLRGVLGANEAALLGRSPLEFALPADREKLAELISSTSRLNSSNDEVRIGTGARILVADVTCHLIELDGRPAVRLILRDQTNLKQLETMVDRAREVAERSDRLAALGRLTAGVAHEINNPLAYVQSNLEEMVRQVEAAHAAGAPLNDDFLAEFRAISSETREGVDRISAIVRALKSSSRSRDDQVRFDPAHAVRDALTIFRGAKRALCRVDADIEDGFVACGAPSGLGQVVINLLENALDAMGGEGIIALRGRKRDAVFELTVSDTGNGIPADVASFVFDPFFTTKPPGRGTGLGLYICREIVQTLGGEISFATSPKGTVFTVTIAAAPVEPDTLES